MEGWPCWVFLCAWKELQVAGKRAPHASKPTQTTLIAERTTDKAVAYLILSMRVALAVQQPPAISKYREKTDIPPPLPAPGYIFYSSIFRIHFECSELGSAGLGSSHLAVTDQFPLLSKNVGEQKYFKPDVFTNMFLNMFFSRCSIMSGRTAPNI